MILYHLAEDLFSVWLWVVLSASSVEFVLQVAKAATWPIVGFPTLALPNGQGTNHCGGG